MTDYDVIIIGAGPAGLATAIYTGRSKLKTLYIEKSATGGQAATTDEIENYPGFLDITGPEIAAKMEAQAKKFGAERLQSEVKAIAVDGNYKILTTHKGQYRAKSLVIASGAIAKPLGCPGEAELRGKGVSYCAVCDAAFYEGATNVMVVGGGDSAVEEAIYLTKFADKVTLVHRRDALRAIKVVQDRAFANPKLHILWDTVPVSINGDDLVESVTVKNVKTGATSQVEVEGVFMYVGMQPNTGFLKGVVTLDKYGYIPTDDDMRTNIPGIFAAGDNRVKSLRQVVTAAADGAIAAFSAEKYIEEIFAR